jgi:hypothetical protein
MKNRPHKSRRHGTPAALGGCKSLQGLEYFVREKRTGRGRETRISNQSLKVYRHRFAAVVVVVAAAAVRIDANTHNLRSDQIRSDHSKTNPPRCDAVLHSSVRNPRDNLDLTSISTFNSPVAL